MQADRPLSRLSAARPVQDQTGTPRNRQARSAAREHRPWLRAPSGALPHRKTPPDVASPTSESPLPRESYSRANHEVFGGVQLSRRSAEWIEASMIPIGNLYYMLCYAWNR